MIIRDSIKKNTCQHIRQPTKLANSDKRTNEEIENLNRPVTCNYIESVI